MNNTLPQLHSRTPPAVTPVKQHGKQSGDGTQHAVLYCGSPIGGVCTNAQQVTAPADCSPRRTRMHCSTASSSPKPPVQRGGPADTTYSHQSASSSASEAWQSASGCSHSRDTRSGFDQHMQQHVLPQDSLVDNALCLDQDSCESRQIKPHTAPGDALATRDLTLGGSGAAAQQSPPALNPQAQQPLLPLHVLLSPLLPSADEAKLVDRLSQLRDALDEHVRLAAGWQQQVRSRAFFKQFDGVP